MKAIRFHALGGPEVLRLEDAPDPTPGPGELLLGVRAIGVNYADTAFRQGTYFVRPVFPQIPGMEAAGEVLALGEGVTGFALGDRVMALGAGAYAERMVARVSTVYPMPAALSFEEAAALPAQGITADHILRLSGRLAPGESVLVHAGAGGVGTLAIQLAKLHGAGRVFATASSPEKLALCRSLGADVVIDYKTESFAERLRAEQKRGVDVILEMLGGAEALERNLASLAPLGRLVVYGAASGDLGAKLAPIGLMAKNQTVTGYYLTPLLRRRELCAPPLAALAAAVAEKRVRVVIGARAPLAEAAELHRSIQSRRTTGKLILVP